MKLEHDPITDQNFETNDKSFGFYQQNAKIKGFSVLKKSQVKRDDDFFRYALLACDKSDKSEKPRDYRSIKRSGRTLFCMLNGFGAWIR